MTQQFNFYYNIDFETDMFGMETARIWGHCDEGYGEGMNCFTGTALNAERTMDILNEADHSEFSTVAELITWAVDLSNEQELHFQQNGWEL